MCGLVFRESAWYTYLAYNRASTVSSAGLRDQQVRSQVKNDGLFSFVIVHGALCVRTAFEVVAVTVQS